MITPAIRRAYSQHLLRAHFGKFRPLTLAQFADVAFIAENFY